MTNELKPCPFCGGEAETFHWRGEWWIACDNDGCENRVETLERATEAEAIAAWNTRTAYPGEVCEIESTGEGESLPPIYPTCRNVSPGSPIERILIFACSECGHITTNHTNTPRVYEIEDLDSDEGIAAQIADQVPLEYCPHCGARVVSENEHDKVVSATKSARQRTSD